jgi:surface polysaccharide O-acyltransferase-like enzyme
MTSTKRRNDIDALKVFAIGILIPYHVCMVYVAGWEYHVKSQYQTLWLELPMLAVNRWFLQLLFLLSGAALGLAAVEKAPLRTALSRSWRLLLPLVFGIFFVVPVQAYYEALSNGAVAPGFIAFLLRYWELRPWPQGGWTGADHGFTWNQLWYIAYLWFYTMILCLTLPIMRMGLLDRARAILGKTGPVLLVVLPIAVLWVFWLYLLPRFPETHALRGDWYLHAQFLFAMFFGYIAAKQESFWDRVAQMRRITLFIAIFAGVTEISLRAANQYDQLQRLPEAFLYVPWGNIEGFARVVFSWAAVVSILGWGRVYLNRPRPWLGYASEAALTWYILHSSFIVPLAYLLGKHQLGPVLEPMLVFFGTILGCYVLYEFVIRRIPLLRPLFGLPFRRRSAVAPVATQS